ncbi:hypothetical protein, partial [Acetomicrobium sp. S15 = DSM 107314]|uniref:hypothetical protein n=1 Tax=Acetomicrobium sp. S15 = DSM 107314 TaxID=2529858 RepID=UPI001E2FEF62
GTMTIWINPSFSATLPNTVPGIAMSPTLSRGLNGHFLSVASLFFLLPFVDWFFELIVGETYRKASVVFPFLFLSLAVAGASAFNPRHRTSPRHIVNC